MQPALQIANTLDPTPMRPQGGLYAISDTEAMSVNTATPLLDAAYQRAMEAERAQAASARSEHAPMTDANPMIPKFEAPPTDPAVQQASADSIEAAPQAEILARPIPISLSPPESDPGDTVADMPPPTASEPPRLEPEELWQRGLNTLIELSREQGMREVEMGQVGLWSARMQWLARLANSDGTSWQALMEALAPGDRLPHAGGEEPTSALEPASAESVTQTSENPPTLAIVTLELCRRIEGYGVYEPLDLGALKIGQSVGLYWEVEGLRSVEQAGQYRTRLASKVEIVPKDGGDPVYSRSLGEAEDLCRRPRRDFFVNTRLSLPTQADPGPYELRLTLDDLEAGTSVTRTLEFRLHR